MIKEFFAKLIFRKKEVIALEGQPYLIRWRLRLPTFVEKLFVINIHKIVRSDVARELHDHPFNFWNIILWGKYREHLQTYSKSGLMVDSDHYGEPYYEDRGFLSIRYRSAKTPHRLELIKAPVWTVVIRSPKFRGWGFITHRGWTSHQLFEQRGSTNEFRFWGKDEKLIPEGSGSFHDESGSTHSNGAVVESAGTHLPAASHNNL